MSTSGHLEKKQYKRSADGRRSIAKERYDDKRPVISVRVSDTQKKRIEEMARTSGKSVGRLIREGLGLEQRDWREAYQSGINRGWQEARKRYAIRIPCVCGHKFVVVGEDQIREVEELLAAHCNWYHRDCRPKDIPISECRLFKNRTCKIGDQRRTQLDGPDRQHTIISSRNLQ